MNVIKYVTTMLVKNYNNSEKFTEADALLRDRMYSRVSKAIDLAKTLSLDVEVTKEAANKVAKLYNSLVNKEIKKEMLYIEHEVKNKKCST